MAAVLGNSVVAAVVRTPPTNNTASHDNHEKINSWVPFSFLYEYGAPLGGPLGRRSSAIMTSLENTLHALSTIQYVQIYGSWLKK